MLQRTYSRFLVRLFILARPRIFPARSSAVPRLLPPYWTRPATTEDDPIQLNIAAVSRAAVVQLI